MTFIKNWQFEIVLVIMLLGMFCQATFGQTAPPIAYTSQTQQCRVTVKQPWAPTPDAGWGVQFQFRTVTATSWSNYESRDTASPYERVRNFAVGTYKLRAVWTRSGSSTANSPEADLAIVAGQACPSSVVVPPPPPPNQNCEGGWVREGAVSETVCQSNGTKQVTYRERYVVTREASGTGTACPVANQSTREVLVSESCTYVPPPPPPTDKPIFGVVDPVVLGQCSSAVHDKHVVDVGLPVKFRTWHPQTDPTGCVYAHEHGFNPAVMQNAEIKAEPVAFGLVGWSHKTPEEPNGHEEPHEGFKVFVANVGDVNDEGRVNRVFSRSVFHMGTGGPRRFTQRFHSAMIRLIHPEFGLKAFTQLMMDTGDTATVCDPRVQAPTKDVMQLNSPCLLDSGYEIWSTQQKVMFQGREVYRSFATPAVFDPITVKNPANVGELVYAWDPRMAASKRFNNDWSGNRGCDRESYAQPGYWYNGNGLTQYWTDAMGNEVAPGTPGALLQEISRSESVGAPATNDGLKQFKDRVNFCQQRSLLGLKN